MLRNSRTTLRIALIAVLLAGFSGAWFALASVHAGEAAENFATFYSQGDWVESLSVFAEQSIDFVLGWTQ
jgi:hypothetical protein